MSFLLVLVFSIFKTLTKAHRQLNLKFLDESYCNSFEICHSNRTIEMLSFFKEQANMLSKIFHHENIKANEGLQILQELAQKFHQDVDKGTNTQDILEISKKLSTLCKFLEMINAGIDSIIGSTDQKTFNQLSNSRPDDLVESRVKDWIRFDFSAYRAGDKIKILILHVVNSENNLCFVQDIGQHCNMDFSNCILDQCELPPVGMVFAINMNAKWLRAIRVDAEPTNSNIRVRLIDRGETLSINSNTCFFGLNSEAQKVPPRGFMCHVEKVNGERMNSLDSISRMVTYDANINAICANTLELDLWSINDEDNVKMLNDSIVKCANGISRINETSKTNGSSKFNGTSEKHKDNPPKNPFLDDDDELDSCVSGPSQREPPTTKAPVCSLPPLPPRKFSPNEPLKIPVRIIQKCVQSKRASVLEKGATLKEPTESNEHVVNGKTESCVIGNNCKTGAHPKCVDMYRENQEKLRDHSHFEPRGMQEFKLPSIGDLIDVFPRHFQSFDEVFVHIRPWEKQFDDLYNTFAELQEQLRPLNYIPRVNDYVLARYSMDNSIYRAKVTQVVDTNSVTVNYIDYGNTESVSIDYLFEWETFCDVIPAQAVCCRIANMRRFCNVSPEKRFEYLANKYADQHCKAEVLDKSKNSLTINLMNQIGIDICDEIIEFYQSNGLPASIV